MPVVTFACPECGKVLKSARPIAAGKKIKCPTCTAVFPMPDKEDEEVTSAVSEKRRPPAPVRDDDDEAPPRSKASRDEDEEDDRPRRKKKGKAPVRRRSGGGVLWLAVGAVVLLLLGGGGAGAYFLLFANVNRGSGNEDPLAFLPPGTEIIQGFDFDALLSDPNLGPQIDRAIRQQNNAGNFLEQCRKETGLEIKDLFARTVLASNMVNALGGVGLEAPGPGGMQAAPPGLNKNLTLVLRPSRPFDQRKIVKSCKDPAHKKAHGKHYYDINEGEFRTLFMPSDRTLILSTRAGADLDALFRSDGTTPSVSADAAALARGVDKATAWAVIPFEGVTRARLDDGLRQAPPVPELKAVLEPLGRAKGVALSAAVAGDKVTIGVTVACPDAAAATQLVQAVEKAWAEQKGQVAGVGLMMGIGGMPKMGKAFSELTGSLKFSADGTMARATADLGRATLGEVVQEVEKVQQQRGGPFGGPPPNFPGRGRGR